MADSFELKLSLFVVLFLSAVYIAYEIVAVPSGGHPFGHALGIMGALLMLMTEFLYSARKRWRLFRFGQVRHWLSFHIFTGIVGPALVIMHTGFDFRGLAGFTMLLTILVVASGFVGRYIYTSVPRTLAGVEISRRDLERELVARRDDMNHWTEGKSIHVQKLAEQYASSATMEQDLSVLQVFSRRFDEWMTKRRIHAKIGQLEKDEQARLKDLERMINRQQRLIRQINSLQTVRNLMGSWQTLHIPLGITLFVSMTIHIGAAIYFGGL
jgi:hypothetical protein